MVVMTNALKSASQNGLQQLANAAEYQHLVLISENAELAEMLQIGLFEQGFQVIVIRDGLRGLLTAHRMMPNLVILGWSPPRLSGLEICQRLRSIKRTTSIILITKKDSVEERVAGFNAGADDCLSLPLAKEELLARVRARLARTHRQPAEDSLLQCAGLLLNRKTREVFRSGQLISLTAKEFDLLEYFMQYPFQVLTRTQILESVWGYNFTVSSNIIEVYVRYLRRKLGNTSENRIIHTVRSVGYVLKEVA